MSDDNAVVESKTKPSGLLSPTVVYVLYIAALFTAIPVLLGVIFAYMGDSRDEVAQNHYQYQIRTFWIGLLYFIVGCATVWIGVGILLLIFSWIFVLVRCIKGLGQYNSGQPVQDVKTWFW